MSLSRNPSRARRAFRIARMAVFIPLVLGVVFSVGLAVLGLGKENPFGANAPKAPAPSAPAEKPATEVDVPPPPEDPAVATVLATNPQTPRELLRAATVLVALKRPDLAKQMLEKLVAASPDEAELLRLHEEFGSASIFRLGSDRDLTPVGKQVLDMIFSAVQRRYQNPEVLKSWIGQLAAAGNGWYQAAEDLTKTGRAAVPLLVEAASGSEGELRGRCIFVLKRLRVDAANYLIALLQSQDAARQKTAAELLGEIGGSGVALFLLAPALSGEYDATVQQAARAALSQLQSVLPTPAQAARLLVAEAESKLKALSSDEENRQPFYFWNSQTSSVEEIALLPAAIRRRTAARLAAEASGLVPGDRDVAVLALSLELEQIGFELLQRAEEVEKSGGQAEEAAPSPMLVTANAGPLVTTAVAQYQDRSDSVLALALPAIEYCMKRQWAGGVWAGIVWYSQNAPRDQVKSAFVNPTPFSQALHFADRRVRWAVVEAAMTLDLKGNFPDSSKIVGELFYFASSRGVRRVVVADGSQRRAMRIVGDLKNLGFESVDTAASGNALLRSVSDDPDVVFVLISADIQEPRIEFLVQRLRADPRTARLPVGIYALPDLLPKSDRLAEGDPLVLSFAEPYRPDDATRMADRLQQLPGYDGGTAAVRKALATLALQRIAALAENPGPNISIQELEDLAVRALYIPGAEKAGLMILRRLGTPRAQTELVEAASRLEWPAALRAEAVSAFGEAVMNRGLQLTRPQILRQYDRYNQSEKLDKVTQKLLGLILDYIEMPSEAHADTTSSRP